MNDAQILSVRPEPGEYAWTSASTAVPLFGARTSTHSTASLQAPLREAVWIWELDRARRTARFSARDSDFTVELCARNSTRSAPRTEHGPTPRIKLSASPAIVLPPAPRFPLRAQRASPATVLSPIPPPRGRPVMDRVRPFPSRRRLLQGAVAAAVPAALLPATHATAQARAVDYPLAEWIPASTSNYTAANRPTTYPIDYVIIHVTQETYADTLAIFQNPAKKVSAHYVVRSKDGHIAQCVRERNVGWHAGNWTYNTRSIGIEHEGWVDKPEYFTNAMYEQSAALTAAICTKYDIPKDREHIIGHHEVPGSDHTDPGPYWDWSRYLRLVNFA